MQVARRSRPPPLRIAPFQDAHLDEVRAKAYMAGVEHALRMVWKCQTSELNFSAIYNMAYKLVLWKQGDKLYELCVGFVRRASLCMREEPFLVFAIMVRDLTMYIERTYVSAQKRTPLIEYARQAYAREVARLWRRVRHVAVKGARITLWRAAFDEVRFRPGGSGWLQARESFQGLVSAQAFV